MRKFGTFLSIGIILFFISILVSYIISHRYSDSSDEISVQNVIISNTIENIATLETAQTEEKISPNAVFALKKYYDECGHFSFKYSELPEEVINLTRQQIEDLYDDWEVEEFSSEYLVLSQEINSICDEHYIVKIGENNVEIYNLGNGGSLNLFRETNISKEYLTEEDLQKLEEGIEVFGTRKIKFNNRRF